MPIPVQQFPILSPGQMSPFHQGLQTGLENYMNLVKAKYMPASMQADIASKSAYATYSPYSYLSKALSDPTTAMLLAQNPEQLKAITTKLAGMPTNPYASLDMQGMSNEGNKNNQSVFDRLKGLFGQNNNQNIPNIDQNKSQVTDQSNKVPIQTSDQNTNKFSPTKITTAGGTPVGYSYTPKNLYEQNYLKAFPNSREALNVKMQNQLWTDKLKEESKNVDMSRNSLTTIEAMENIYPQLAPTEKGVFLGNLPAVSSKAQQLDQLAQIQATTNMRSLQTGHITNTDFQIGNKLKGNRGQNEDAFSASINYNKALKMRDIQRQRFMSDAFNRGMQTQDADTLWSKFIEKYPLFNPKTEKLIDKNQNVSPFDVSYENSESKSENKNNSKGGFPNLPVSQGAKILAKHIKLPNFGSRAEYKSWLRSQPKITQDAIIEYFRNKGRV